MHMRAACWHSGELNIDKRTDYEAHGLPPGTSKVVKRKTFGAKMGRNYSLAGC